MRSYTVDEIMELEPCFDYPRERVQRLWSRTGKERLTELDILDLPIPRLDRIWGCCVVYREAWVLPSVEYWVKKIGLGKEFPSLANWAHAWLSGDDRSFETAAALYNGYHPDSCFGSPSGLLWLAMLHARTMEIPKEILGRNSMFEIAEACLGCCKPFTRSEEKGRQVELMRKVLIAEIANGE